MKDQLEGLVNQMVERGILFDEAVGEFEKRFIKRVLDRTNGNQSKAAELLGILGPCAKKPQTDPQK